MHLSIFNYKGTDLAVIGLNGMAWFILSEVCDLIGISDIEYALSKLEPEEMQVFMAGKDKKTIIVSSIGIESLHGVNTELTDWIFDKVEPALKKKESPPKRTITKQTDNNISKGLNAGKPPKLR